MKKILISTLLSTILMMALTADANLRDIYEFTFEGKNYEVVKQTMNWSNAAAFAVERGGYLVEINSIAEQAAIHDAIINGAEVSPYYTSVSNGGNIAYVWIGATDQDEEGTWIWDGNNDNTGINFWNGQGANGANNGTNVNNAFYNWGGSSTGVPKEPDNYGAGQHYAAIGLTGWPAGTTMLGIAGEWNDIIGSALLYFVIEFDNSSGAQNYQIEENLNFVIYPNLLNASTIVSFSLPEQVNINLSIYNIKGQKVTTLANREFESGRHKIVWSGKDKSNNAVSSGIYLYKLDVNGRTEAVKKCLLLR